LPIVTFVNAYQEVKKIMAVSIILQIENRFFTAIIFAGSKDTVFLQGMYAA